MLCKVNDFMSPIFQLRVDEEVFPLPKSFRKLPSFTIPSMFFCQHHLIEIYFLPHESLICVIPKNSYWESTYRVGVVFEHALARM